jgi:hypothetical protein
MLRGFDLVTLAVAVPALLLGAWLAGRGSRVGQLVWLGVLAYLVYTYAFYLFGAAFNSLLLVHVAVFALSLIALVRALVAVDAGELARGFRSRTPARIIAGLLLFLAVPIGAVWVAYAVRFAITGELPPPTLVVQPPESLHLTYVLDLALIVPGYGIAAALLWRRAAWGYVSAAVALVSGVVNQLAYLSVLASQARDGIPGATAFDPLELPILAVYLLAAALLLGNLRPVREQGSGTGPAVTGRAGRPAPG